MFSALNNANRSIKENIISQRPMLPENIFFDEKKENTQTKEGEEIFNKLIKKKQEEKFELKFPLSPISPKANAFMDIGPLEEVKLDNAFLKDAVNKKKIRSMHICMKNFDDLLINLRYLFDDEKIKYKYYFVYEYEHQYYIQISTKFQKEINLNKMGDCEFLNIITNDEFLELIEKNLIIDIRISLSNPFLYLTEGGRANSEKKLYLNEKLIQYCFSKNIPLFYNDL